MHRRSSQKLVFRWLFFSLVLLLISQFMLPRTLLTTGTQISPGTINTVNSTIACDALRSSVKLPEVLMNLPSAVAVDPLKRGVFVNNNLTGQWVAFDNLQLVRVVP